MAFSWKQAKIDAINMKVRRAKTQAHNQHPDFKRVHPSEAREASEGKYTLLTQRVIKEVKEFQDKAIARRLKTVGR